jgi:predicted secreted protein
MGALTLAAVSVLGAIDPGVTPNDSAPWMPALRQIAGMVLTTTIVIAVILLVIAAVTWAVGKATHNSQAQSVGVGGMIIIGIAAAVIASASGLIMWFTSVNLA